MNRKDKDMTTRNERQTKGTPLLLRLGLALALLTATQLAARTSPARSVQAAAAVACRDCNDLVARNTAGDLMLYPFDGTTFVGSGQPVGHGFSGFTDYFVGYWTGERYPDLVARNTAGDLMLYPFDGTTFVGSGQNVGHGFTGFSDYFTERWTGRTTM